MEYVAYGIIYLIILIFGLCIGSFLNVVVYRVPRGISIAKGRSFCPDCGHALSAPDLVPVFSWLLLGGRCRYCGGRISPRYMVIELAGGALAVLCLAVFWLSWTALTVFAACCILLCVAVIDAKTQEIPNGLVLALLAPAAAAVFFLPGVGLLEHGIGIFVISLPMLLLTILIKGSFGGGDIKLMAVCGLMLGWKLTLLAGFAALVTGGAWAVFLLCSGRRGRKAHFAFGPFLSFGTALSMFCGAELINAYLSLFIR